MFNSSVHEQILPKVSKFSYLKGVLKDSAAAVISGILITTKNYKLAITLLKERFGKRRLLSSLSMLSYKVYQRPTIGLVR